MKSTKAIVGVLAVALTLGGCYWVPPDGQPGGVAIKVSVPRQVGAGIVYMLRVRLYDSADVIGLYGPYSPTPPSSTDPAAGGYILVSAKGDPLPIGGQKYLDLPLSDQAIFSGSEIPMTIPDIAAGRKYRLHVQYGESYLGFNMFDEGVSKEFEVVPGDVVDVTVELYFPWSYP